MIRDDADLSSLDVCPAFAPDLAEPRPARRMGRPHRPEADAPRDAPEPAASVPLRLGGEIRAFREVPEALRPVWEQGLAAECRDHRYFELERETVRGRFEHLYLAVADRTGAVRAVQPAFVVREDLLAGVPPRLLGAVRMARRLYPRLLVTRMLMVGSPTGAARLVRPVGANPEWLASALAEALPDLGRQLRTPVVVFKDVPASERGTLAGPLARSGFTRVPSMPDAELPIDFADFDEYMATRLSHSRRRDLRRKFKRADRAGPLRMEVLRDLSPIADEAYALYRQVFERARYTFEELTPDYLRGLGDRLGDRALFFVWRLRGRPVAVSICLAHDGVLEDCYLGMDYGVALDLHLYFVSLRDILSWAARNGMRAYRTTPLSYKPKLALHMRLAPLDLYVRHRRGLVNPAFRRLVPHFGPTRFDRDLPRFSNFRDLESDPSSPRGSTPASPTPLNGRSTLP